jgi:hypothetical protein
MRVRDEYRDEFEQLDERRRRVYEDFNLLVQQIREGSVRDVDRVRLEAQHLQVRHTGLIEQMVDLLSY